ncbi:MAG: hypothetical protein AB7P07_01175 [Hyphomonadaceae bacterium]
MSRFLAFCMAALASLALSNAPVSAQVPDPFARQLAQDLAQFDAVHGYDGFARAAGPFAGALARGETQRFTVTLRSGHVYRAAGACDARCRALDLRLYDPNGVLIAEDDRSGAAPVLAARPQFTGPHTIEARMARCAEPPCYFAFNVYTR